MVSSGIGLHCSCPGKGRLLCRNLQPGSAPFYLNKNHFDFVCVSLIAGSDELLMVNKPRTISICEALIKAKVNLK